MWVTASPRAKRIVLASWAVFAVANLGAMWVFPGMETIPIHFAREDSQTEEDLAIVLDELGKLDRLTGRLTTLMQLHAPAEVSTVDIDSLADRLVRRWTPVAERAWEVDSTAGTVEADEER